MKVISELVCSEVYVAFTEQSHERKRVPVA